MCLFYVSLYNLVHIIPIPEEPPDPTVFAHKLVLGNPTTSPRSHLTTQFSNSCIAHPNRRKPANTFFLPRIRSSTQIRKISWGRKEACVLHPPAHRDTTQRVHVFLQPSQKSCYRCHSLLPRPLLLLLLEAVVVVVVSSLPSEKDFSSVDAVPVSPKRMIHGLLVLCRGRSR